MPTTHVELLGAYNPERGRLLIEAFKLALPEAIAAGYARITLKEYRRWVALGEAGEEPFRTLLEERDKAVSNHAAQLALNLYKMANDPEVHHAIRSSNAKWLLERRHPGYRERIEVEPRGRGDEPERQTLNLAGMSREDVLALCDMAEAELAARGLPPDPALLEDRSGSGSE